ncbi:type IV toxin-antitoxin system AbiEi family antitoxin domain-containing protein [Williamsia muralis]|uniref:type IV toxin-antitoxin system AbiEi family antitoxin domain-containing protein n=1 Tax=Williamsia marianensis TaxID=85044 RepID=UPI00117BF6A4|nr:type IV toxin-antitoxin system AbiEi family antitoxin domain-containing protein [Williamsia marianensis]
MDTTRWHGAVTRGELMGLGYTPSEIRSALRAGIVYALAPGIFALPTLRALPREEQHREFSCAMARGVVAAGALPCASRAGLNQCARLEPVRHPGAAKF